MKNFICALVALFAFSSSVFGQNFGGGGTIGGLISNYNIIRNSGGVDLSYGNVAAVANAFGNISQGAGYYRGGGYSYGYQPAYGYQQPSYAYGQSYGFAQPVYAQPQYGYVQQPQSFGCQSCPGGVSYGGQVYSSPYGNVSRGGSQNPYGSAYTGSVAPSDMGLHGSAVYQQMGISTAPTTQQRVQQRTNDIYRQLGY